MNLIDNFSLSLLLAAVGLLLIIAEVFFPSGGVLGFFSGLSLLAAVYYAYLSGGWSRGVTFALVEVLVAPFVIYGALQVLPHTPIGRVLVCTAPTPEEVDPKDDRESLIGRIGIARSKLLPSGAVEIDSRILDCVSRGQAIEPGEYVKVTEVSANRVVVRRVDPDSKTEPSRPEELLARPADEIGLSDFDFDSPDREEA